MTGSKVVCSMLASGLAVLLVLEADDGAILFHRAEMAGPGIPAVGPVEGLMRVTEEACFVRGGDAEALKKLAETSHWKRATTEQLAGVQENEFTRVVGGWTVTSEFGATAVIQSELRKPQRGHVCSVTTQFPDAGLHPKAKSAFQKHFDAVIDEELDSPDQHIDRFWIERGKGPPVKATMVFTHSRRMITIRMIHGNVRPMRS